jgi:hypothetical protein
MIPLVTTRELLGFPRKIPLSAHRHVRWQKSRAALRPAGECGKTSGRLALYPIEIGSKPFTLEDTVPLWSSAGRWRIGSTLCEPDLENNKQYARKQEGLRLSF